MFCDSFAFAHGLHPTMCFRTHHQNMPQIGRQYALERNTEETLLATRPQLSSLSSSSLLSVSSLSFLWRCSVGFSRAFIFVGARNGLWGRRLLRLWDDVDVQLWTEVQTECAYNRQTTSRQAKRSKLATDPKPHGVFTTKPKNRTPVTSPQQEE